MVIIACLLKPKNSCLGFRLSSRTPRIPFDVLSKNSCLEVVLLIHTTFAQNVINWNGATSCILIAVLCLSENPRMRRVQLLKFWYSLDREKIKRREWTPDVLLNKTENRAE